MQIRIYFLFLIQIIFLLGISLVSNYHLPDLTSANWSTVLFLTPIGIMKNFVDTNPVMKSFYSDYSKGQVSLNDFRVAIILVLVILLVGVFREQYKILKVKGLQ